MKEKNRFPLSIRSLVMLFCLPFVSMVLISCAFFYQTGRRQIHQLVQLSADGLVNQVSKALNEKLSQVEILPHTITSSSYYYKIRQNIADDKPAISPSDYKAFSNSVYNFLVMNAGYFDSVFFYLDNHSITLYRSNSDRRLYKVDFSFEQYEKPFSPYSISWMDQNLARYPYTTVDGTLPVNGLIEIIGNKDTLVHGVLLFGINDELFTSSLTNCKITPSSCVTLVKNGQILYSSAELFGCDTLERLPGSDRELLMKKTAGITSGDSLSTTVTYESSGNYYIYQPLQYGNMGVLAVIPSAEMYLDYHQFSKYAIQFALLLITTCLILYFIITHLMTRPIRSLVRQLNYISEDNLDTSLHVKGGKEIHMICSSVNNLIFQVNVLMKRLQLEMLAKQKAEIQALYFQINPHFLYNALDSIHQLCDLGELEVAGQMIDQLATFYRIGVSKGMEEITLRDETTHVRMYLEILKTRFEDFQYCIHIPEEYLNCAIIKLVFQPIVENAIYHGLRPYRTDGLLEITAQKEGTDLLILIRDDGSGIEDHVLEEIRSSLKAPMSEKSASVYGIKNVHDRLRLTYGASYGLTIESAVDEGTTVCLKIPYVDKPALKSLTVHP